MLMPVPLVHTKQENLARHEVPTIYPRPHHPKRSLQITSTLAPHHCISCRVHSRSTKAYELQHSSQTIYASDTNFSIFLPADLRGSLPPSNETITFGLCRLGKDRHGNPAIVMTRSKASSKLEPGKEGSRGHHINNCSSGRKT